VLVERDAVAVMTPYARGRKQLPSDEDVARIKMNVNQAFCTAWPQTRKPPKRGAADKTLNEVTKQRRAIRKQPGHIRMRVPSDGSTQDVTVELYDGAKKL
jgi:hypothetical protein